MAQKLIQTQTQKQVQVQRLSQQQMLQVKLLEMPITELEESVTMELDDNPALEVSSTEDALSEDRNDHLEEEEENFDERNQREEREDALDSALENIGRDDEMPTTFASENYQNADYEEIVYGDTTSFYDKLKEQMAMEQLTDKQCEVMEYLIGSLDDDGLLRKSIDSICDELAIYQNLDVSEKEITDVLNILKTFDPPGIGACSLQECLLLQIDRKPDGKLKAAMRTIISDYYDEFTKKHWDKIQTSMDLSDLQVESLQNEILKLNPKPGAALGETIGRSLQQITPDFLVDTGDDGTVTFSLNRGNVPELKVSPSFADMVNEYKNNKQGISRQTKEALLYAKGKVDKAMSFIQAVKQRRHTMFITMKAIIEWQYKFFQNGDEADLKPMILKNIADKTGLDISTISRVSNIKYAQTKWGTFPLRFFFTDSYTSGNGDETSTRKIKIILKEVIDQEDKSKPLSDDFLAGVMKKHGYPIARRTVAKYREQMGIPIARLRRK